MRRTNRRVLEALVISLAQTQVAPPARRSADIYTITPADLSEADLSGTRPHLGDIRPFLSLQ